MRRRALEPTVRGASGSRGAGPPLRGREVALEREADRVAERLATGSGARSGRARTAASACSDLGGRLGYDFSRVRVHHDEDAGRAAAAVGARAFTSGRDVFFGRGAFAPHTREGRRLLAHELVHVAQQGEAERVDPAARGVLRSASGSVQRKVDEDRLERTSVERIMADPDYFENGIRRIEFFGAEYGGALRIGEIDADDGHAAVAFSRIPASGRQPPVTMVGDRVVSFVARGMVTVRGNTFEGGGRDPIVAIVADGPCSLNENRCLVVERLSQPAVAVDASSVIAGSNRLETGGKVALQIVRAVPHTVIGNICRGEIQVQGAPLGDPWKPLNIEQ